MKHDLGVYKQINNTRENLKDYNRVEDILNATAFQKLRKNKVFWKDSKARLQEVTGLWSEGMITRIWEDG